MVQVVRIVLREGEVLETVVDDGLTNLKSLRALGVDEEPLAGHTNEPQANEFFGMTHSASDLAFRGTDGVEVEDLLVLTPDLLSIMETKARLREGTTAGGAAKAGR